MKIGPIDTKAVSPATAPQGKATSARGAAATEEASATVALSSASALGAQGSGDFDTAKVERVAQAIRDGSFKINAEAIADKLISNAADLLGKPQRG